MQNKENKKDTREEPREEYHEVERSTWLGIRTPKDFEIDLVTSEISGYLRSPSPPDFLSVCTHARWENCIQRAIQMLRYDQIKIFLKKKKRKVKIMIKSQ